MTEREGKQPLVKRQNAMVGPVVGYPGLGWRPGMGERKTELFSQLSAALSPKRRTGIVLSTLLLGSVAVAAQCVWSDLIRGEMIASGQAQTEEFTRSDTITLKRAGFEITIPSRWEAAERIFRLASEDKRASEAWVNVLPLKFVDNAMSPRHYFHTKYPASPYLDQLEETNLAGWEGLRLNYQVGEADINIVVVIRGDELREVSAVRVGDNAKTKQEVQQTLLSLKFTSMPIR